MVTDGNGANGVGGTLWLHPHGEDAPRHNYVRKMNAMIAAGAFNHSQVGQVTIAHDNDCAIFTGGYCGCNPDISLNVIQGKPGRN